MAIEFEGLNHNTLDVDMGVFRSPPNLSKVRAWLNVDVKIVFEKRLLEVPLIPDDTYRRCAVPIW